MEGDSTNELTEAELRDAGASATFITYYQTAKEMGESTPATNHIESCLEEDTFYSGGGFFDSLWNASPRFKHSDNPYGADDKNQRILEEAGVYPYAEGVTA